MKKKFVSSRFLWTIWSIALVLLVIGGCGLILHPGSYGCVSLIGLELVTYVGAVTLILFSTEIYISKQHQKIKK